MTKIIERKDISDFTFEYREKHVRSITKYRDEYFEIDGALYIKYDDHYESCSDEHLRYYNIKEFEQSSQTFFRCICLNDEKFKIYRHGYEARAICCKCNNDFLIYMEQ